MLLLLALAGCSGGQKVMRFNGPPKDSRYLGVALVMSSMAVLKSEQIATKNGARVDFYLLNLTPIGWKATVSFPRVPAAYAICQREASEITDVALGASSDNTAKCVLNKPDVDAYCDSIAPNEPQKICEVDYSITFTASDGSNKKIVDPKLEIQR
jgi:hypothetical protein